MSGKTIRSLVKSWETVRFELLKTRISSLHLAVEGSPVERFVLRLRREMEAKRLRFQPDEVEDPRTIMMFLRHEAGHAVNYAYRLWRRPSWGEIFGPFTKPYRDYFRPDRMSRQYVRHIAAPPYGRTYAQKHPDEDFAETFAVWLTPRSNWRERYRNWPALEKLEFVDAAMRSDGREKPRR